MSGSFRSVNRQLSRRNMTKSLTKCMMAMGIVVFKY